MQKFGLQRNSSSRHSAIELEIVKEQASALGRAGRKLRLSLEKHQSILNGTQSISDMEHSILEIANNVWELILQREFLGFTEGNFQWVQGHYHIPEAVLNHLGLGKK